MEQEIVTPTDAECPAASELSREMPRGCGTGLLWFAGLLLLFVIFAFWQFHGYVNKVVRADAQSTTMAIYNAVDQYHAEYERLPAPESATIGRDWDTNSSAEENLISILKGRDADANLKAIDFLGDIKDAKQEGGKFLNGVILTGAAMALVDPWGQPYHIRLDGDGDGFVANPNPGDYPVTRIAKPAIIWSAGKDGDPETWKDNVGSWTSASY